MEILTQADVEAVAQAGATFIAAQAREAVAARGRFVVAISGGKTPWRMLRALAEETVPWSRVRVVQVDERIAPNGHPDRNLTHLRESLPDGRTQVYPMPVDEPVLEAAAIHYAQILKELVGSPPVLDLVHLGLGTDGHTASLVPGDPVLDVMERDVAITGSYQGHRRMTLTYPILNRARRILWLVTGSDKTEMLTRLRLADRSIPAGRIRQESATIIADYAATGPGARVV